MATLPMADARSDLSKIIESAGSTYDRYEVTRNGRRIAVIIGAGD
jgi:antitoxin YefM